MNYLRLHDISNVEIVNGGEVSLVKQEYLQDIFELQHVDGLLVIGEKKLQMDIRFIQKYPEGFDLGLILLHWHEWYPVVIYKSEKGLQKVFIEKIQCESCEWKGSIANPLVAELYYAHIKSKTDQEYYRRELNKAYNKWKRSLPCPVCSSKLRRFAIWTEKDPS